MVLRTEIRGINASNLTSKIIYSLTLTATVDSKIWFLLSQRNQWLLLSDYLIEPKSQRKLYIDRIYCSKLAISVYISKILI